MNHRAIAAVVAGIAPVIRDYVAKGLTELTTRVVALEARAPVPGEKGDAGEHGEKGDQGEKGDTGEAGQKGEQGPPGEKGDRGNSGAPGDPGSPGEKGEPGLNGKDADPVEVAKLLVPEVERAVASLPKPKDGRDADPLVIERMVQEAVAGIPAAKDGKDADLEQVAALVGSEVEKAVAAIPRAKDGRDADPIIIKQVAVEAVSELVPVDLAFAPDDVANQVAKAVMTLAESPIVIGKTSPLVLNINGSGAERRKTITTRKDKDGNLVADVVEHRLIE